MAISLFILSGLTSASIQPEIKIANNDDPIIIIPPHKIADNEKSIDLKIQYAQMDLKIPDKTI